MTGSPGVRIKNYTFEVSATCTFPEVNLKCGKGVSSPRGNAANSSVLSAQTSHEAHEESGEVYECAGVAYDLDPTVYIPSLQPIELFWLHGKQYASFNSKTRRALAEAWEKVRRWWYGDPMWEGQEEGCEPADCSKLVVIKTLFSRVR